MPYVTTWVNLDHSMPTEINELQKDNSAWFYLYVVSKIVKLMKAETWMLVAWDWGERWNGELLFQWYQVLFMQDVLFC